MSEQNNLASKYKALVTRIAHLVNEGTDHSKNLMFEAAKESSTLEIITQHYYAEHSSYLDYFYSFIDDSLPFKSFRSDIFISSFSKSYAKRDIFKEAFKEGIESLTATYALIADAELFTSEQHAKIILETYKAIKNDIGTKLLKDILSSPLNESEQSNNDTFEIYAPALEPLPAPKDFIHLRLGNEVDMNCEILTEETTSCNGITTLDSVIYCCHYE